MAAGGRCVVHWWTLPGRFPFLLQRVAPLLQPYGRKVTLETEVVAGQVWTHDQAQGTVNVMVPTRQTVIKLRGGGLFVHAPGAVPMRQYGRRGAFV